MIPIYFVSSVRCLLHILYIHLHSTFVIIYMQFFKEFSEGVSGLFRQMLPGIENSAFLSVSLIA